MVSEIINTGKNSYKVYKHTNKNSGNSFYTVSRDGHKMKLFDEISEVEDHYPNLVGKINL